MEYVSGKIKLKREKGKGKEGEKEKRGQTPFLKAK